MGKRGILLLMSGMGTKDNSSSISAPTSNPKHSSHSQLRFPLLVALFICLCVCLEVVCPPHPPHPLSLSFLPPPFHSTIIHFGEGSPSFHLRGWHTNTAPQRHKGLELTHAVPRQKRFCFCLFVSLFLFANARFPLRKAGLGGGGGWWLVWVCSTEAGLAQR